MNKEELKQEAEKYFKSICEDYNEEYERTGKRHYFVGFDIKNAYLASAEPREKRIAELEQKLEQTEKDLADYQFNYPTIKELEKENAELKENYDERGRIILSLERQLRLNIHSDQLTKAKKILHKICYEFGIYDKDLIEEAKQFLKDSEVEK